MRNGKKQLAEKIVYQAIEQAAKKLESDNELAVFEQAMKNISPNMEVKSRRVGGANYQIPYEVRGTRQTHLAMMWLVDTIRTRRGSIGKSSTEVLAAEIVDAYNNAGVTVKKREDTHKMAEANRAFAHFARY